MKICKAHIYCLTQSHVPVLGQYFHKTGQKFQGILCPGKLCPVTNNLKMNLFI